MTNSLRSQARLPLRKLQIYPLAVDHVVDVLSIEIIDVVGPDVIRYIRVGGCERFERRVGRLRIVHLHLVGFAGRCHAPENLARLVEGGDRVSGVPREGELRRGVGRAEIE